MQVVNGLITFFLILAAMLGLFWTFFGIPLGIVLAKLRSQNKVVISNKHIWLLAAGGIIALIVALVLYFILSATLFATYGSSYNNLKLPEISE